MKFFRLDLLTLLISLFILGSCKNPDAIGLGIDPTQASQATLIDTATITATTLLDDSVLTNSVGNAPLAYFKDPIFGTTEANIAASLNLPGSSSFTLPAGTITIDSSRLVLNYADGFYGDSLTTKYKVNVYQLTEPLVSSKSYYNNKVWAHSNTLLGTQSFFVRQKDSIKITDIVTGAKDTLKKVAPQIRIPILNSFVFNNFFGATTSQLNNNSVFLNAVKGLYITLDKAGTTGGPGGNIYFKLGSGASSLVVYYRVNHGSTIDTSIATLPLGNPHALEIKHDYSNAPAISAQLSNPASSATVYLQGLSGLRSKISFPYLRKILPANITSNDIAINRAELVITPVAGTTIPYVPTPRLTLYRFDIAHQRVTVPDATSGDPHYLSVGSFGGFYDDYHKTYNFIITGYVEDLIRGKVSDYGTYLAPADTTGYHVGSASINIGNTPIVGSRVVIGGNKTSPYRMKLNIIYSKVTK
ncbi:hypothetical protein BEL04_21175 [Mucilaginibacter sp. PPCGB 2223]|uniref:DUF4270 domain-containing protein n=1 Tax=Mucilaginibacter sp. PPCGB 2223 TaxID=1886027 RepID=UPI000825992D|nr:DUF4270 domain-containing protein [Mucilaginibacter sp. PPCGB 2223]OCX51217.1 hypothetical protein BEL04_21175 [Mucilaginibacter sp. PPCGB 2223]